MERRCGNGCGPVPVSRHPRSRPDQRSRQQALRGALADPACPRPGAVHTLQRGVLRGALRGGRAAAAGRPGAVSARAPRASSRGAQDHNSRVRKGFGRPLPAPACATARGQPAPGAGPGGVGTAGQPPFSHVLWALQLSGPRGLGVSGGPWRGAWPPRLRGRVSPAGWTRPWRPCSLPTSSCSCPPRCRPSTSPASPSTWGPSCSTPTGPRSPSGTGTSRPR